MDFILDAERLINLEVNDIRALKGMVSVVIPTYNRRVDLDKCLSTVLEQSYENREIIVVDDGSRDDTVEYVQKRYPLIRLIANKENRGLNYCRNVGTLHSRGEYILFLDSDIELPNKDRIRIMVEIAEDCPDLGGLGAYYHDEFDHVARACTFTEWIFFSLKDDEALQECDFVTGGNLFIRKKLLYENNGFDEFIKGDSTELELGMNLRRKGFRNLFGPKVALKHNASPVERNNISLRSNSRNVSFYERLIWRRTNRLRYFLKNNGIWRAFYDFAPYSAEDMVSAAAFVKQQFLGLKVATSENFPTLREKLRHFYFLIKRIFKPFLWNLIHLRETIRCRKINFITCRKYDASTIL